MNGSLKLRLLDGRFAISVPSLAAQLLQEPGGSYCRVRLACVTSLVRCSLHSAGYYTRTKCRGAPFIAAQLSFCLLLLRSEEEAAAHAICIFVWGLTGRDEKLVEPASQLPRSSDNVTWLHYLTPIRQRDHVLTIPAPPPTEQRYLGIRDLVMGFEIQWFIIEFAVWGRLVT